MKYFLHTLTILISIAISAADTQAQVITAEHAQNIANKFFSANKQKSKATRSAATPLTKSADSHILNGGNNNEAPTFHILSTPHDKGFVIVSGEEIENPIIGYSFDSSLPTEGELPTGLADYLSNIDTQIRALRKYNAEHPQKTATRNAAQKATIAETGGNAVVHLETASWGQDAPFNSQCFTSYGGSTNAKTGCVPTAYAIIMRHHCWPLAGTGKLYHSLAPTLVEITDRTYDYDKMPLVYDGNWSTEQINEVAKLMSHLGQAFMVTYGTGNTSVSDSQSTDRINKYFNYDLVYASYQTNFTIDEWKEKIKESLNNNCPIPYASDNASTGDTRHMFVLDGYTDNDYYHFNFGWNGNGNGWFKLDNIKPSTGDDYSWQSGADHYAIFNLTPNKTKYPISATVSPDNAGTVSIDGSAAASSAEGTFLEGFNVTLSATANTGYTFSHWSKDGEQISTNKNCSVKIASSNNQYVANFITVGSTTVNVNVTYNSNYGTVSNSNGTVAAGSTLTPYENEEITLTATPNSGYIFTGWTVTKGTESTSHSSNQLTIIANGETSIEAHFALAEQDYTLSPSTVGLSGSSKVSTINYTITTGKTLSLTATNTNASAELYAMSRISDEQIRLYAYALSDAQTAYNEVRYTLSAPEGYTITKYSLEYSLNNTRYPCTISYGNGSTASPADTKWHPISATVNSQTAEFTMTATTAHTSSNFYIKNFTVTIMKDGSGSATDPTPVTYTIRVTADAGGSAFIGTGTSKTVTKGESVTLTAQPDNGYTFTGWYREGNFVSNNASYTFTPTSDGTYNATFQAQQEKTYTVTTTASPAEGGTATVAVGTSPAAATATVSSGSEVTLIATANAGYTFTNWTSGTNIISTNATTNITITANSEYVANFDKKPSTTEYPTPSGTTSTTRYLTTATTTGAHSNINYTANAHPGTVHVEVPGTIQATAGSSFTLNLEAFRNGPASASTVYEDMRYCHVSLFTDFDKDYTFQTEAVQKWGKQPPTNNVYGNYDEVMNIAATINIPQDAPTGTSRIRFIYTNAWDGWPANGTATVTDGLVYDFTVEVVEQVEITVNASEGGSVTINGEATSTKIVTKGSEVTIAAIPDAGYTFTRWSNSEGTVSENIEYTFTATNDAEYIANFRATASNDNVKEHNIITNNNSGKLSEQNPNSNENNFYKVWSYNSSPSIKITSSDYTITAGDASINLQSADSYTISLPDGYTILSYTINYTANTTVTIEPGVTAQNNARSNSMTFTAENINAGSSTFSLSTDVGRYIQVSSIDIRLQETESLVDGKAYRIKGRMGDGSFRYIYREGNTIKWSTTHDDSNGSIFIVQKRDDGAISLISGTGYYGWSIDGTFNASYAPITTAAGTTGGTFTLCSEEEVGTGTNSYCYSAHSNNADATSGEILRTAYSGTGTVDQYGTTDFVFEEVAYAFNVRMARGSNGNLGTINLPFSATLPEGITAYKIADNDADYVYVSPLQLTDDILPANTPVLLEGEEATEYAFTPAAASTTLYDTGFCGTLAEKTISADVTAYILSYKGDGTPFKLYKLDSNDRTIKANKAYYEEKNGNSSALQFKFIGTTSVEIIMGEKEEQRKIYNLQGHKINEISAPGIYIVNGKKIFVK